VHRSLDGGTTWTETTIPEGSWISVDMSTDGQTMVALGFGGAMYRSLNGGTTWSAIDTAFNPSGSLGYESVTLSGDGTTIVAVDIDGNVYRSVNGTAAVPVFTVTNTAGAAFRAIDSSTDGSVVAMASQNGDLYLSTNGGAAFVPMPIVVGGSPVTDGWYRIAVSPDGNTIAVVGNTDYAGSRVSTGIYVSRDRGVTWTRGSSISGPYTSIDTSTNGDIIVATMSGAGQVLRSVNGGTSFSPIATPAGETNWRAVAISGNAGNAVLAAGTFFAATGRVYTSTTVDP
jgi:photosystem II stability/assembly factor-like uncharacterized protein